MLALTGLPHAAVLAAEPLAVAPSSPPAPAPQPVFRIASFAIEGATLVAAPVLQAAVAPLTGENRRFSDIEEAVQAVKAAYERIGITAVQISVPEQALESGVVRLQVDELKIARVDIQGAKARGEDNIRRTAPSLQPGRTPVDTQLSQELRLANENPGRQMQVTFSPVDAGGGPGAGSGGELVAVMRVADRGNLLGQATLDNTGNEATGRWRVGASLQHFNLFDRDIVGALQLQTSPGHVSDVKIALATVRVPLYDLGLLLEGSALHSSVDSGRVQTAAGSYLLASSGDSYGLKLTRLLPRWDRWEPRLSAGFERKSVQSDVKTVASGPSAVPDIVLHPLTVTYTGLWRDDTFNFYAALGVTRNIPGGGRGSAEAFAAPGLRAGANPRYVIVRPAVSVSVPWPGLGSIEAQWNGQFTSDALVSAEQFGIGGDGSVRGFSNRVASGDRGHRLSLEFQSVMQSWLEQAGINVGWQVFAEAGQVKRNRPQPGEKGTSTLMALGGGIRLAALERVSLKLDLGIVARGDGLARGGDRFGHVTVTYGF